MKTIKISFFLIFLIVLASCSTQNKRGKEYYENLLKTMDPADGAVSLIGAANGSNVAGEAVFVTIGDAADKVVGMAIKVVNLTPGKHALHMHQFGSCGNEAKDAGGHWNPAGEKHGHRGVDAHFHQGDITNLEVGADGSIFWYGEIEGWTIGGDEATSILGKSLVIHAGEDDFVSQPGGNAGQRVGCGTVDTKKE